MKYDDRNGRSRQDTRKSGEVPPRRSQNAQAQGADARQANRAHAGRYPKSPAANYNEAQRRQAQTGRPAGSPDRANPQNARSNGYADPRRAQNARPNANADPRRAQNARPNGYADPRRAQNARPNGYADPRRAQNARPNGYADPRRAQNARPNANADPRRAQNARPNGPSQYRDPRAAEYIRQRREAELRAERARRAEYERRRAVAREARRRLEEQLRKERRIKRKRQAKIFFGRALVSLIIFAILLVTTGIATALHFSLSPDAPPSSVTYAFGGAVKREASKDAAYRNGTLYVCFNDVASYLSLAVSGGTDGMRFVFADTDGDCEGDGSEDSVTFMTDSRTVLVNSQQISLPAESFLYGEEIWVSAEFIETFVDGLTVTANGDRVSVSRVEDAELSTEDETVYLPVSLKLKAADSIPEFEDSDAGVAPKVEFNTDLSEYESFMAPENDKEFLILASTASPLYADYAPEDIVEVAATRDDGRETQYLRYTAAKALEALFIEMKAAGFTDVSVTSGYRSYEYQSTLHESYIAEEMAQDPALTREEAEAIVSTYSALPGTSEHQTGLCVDMHNQLSANEGFAQEEVYKWLTQNAWKFGFTLRYPEGKTDKTGITFEPWHWRFVGREAAWQMLDRGLCLEEYIDG